MLLLYCSAKAKAIGKEAWNLSFQLHKISIFSQHKTTK